MLWKALPLIPLFCVPSLARAQDYIDEISNYAERVQARRISPLDAESAFGSQISHLDGSTRFSVVDVTLPGNNPLPVEVRRTRSMEERYLTRDARLYAFGNAYDWALDVPYIEGTFSSQGWVVGPSTDPDRHARCSRPQKPYMVLSGDFYEEKMWGGYSLNLPGKGGRLLLKTAPGVPVPQDGRSYPWVAEDSIRVACLSRLADGQPGEGFIVLDGDGLTYTFDTMITRQMANFRMRSYHSVSQFKVYIAASKVEDRNGNWVRYNYENGFLTAITGSDGRNITLGYSNGRLATVSANGRTWSYHYRDAGVTADGGLAEVVLPDGARWSYSWSGSLRPAKMPAPQESDTPCDMIVGRVDGPYRYTIGHPAGASATYAFEHKTMLRSNLDACSAPVQPNYYSLWSLTERVIDGPGINAQRSSFEVSTAYPGDGVRWSKATWPDGSSTRFAFGKTYRVDEGKLMRQTTLAADGTTLRDVVNEYHSSPPSGVPYMGRIGDSMHFMQAADGLVQPQWKTTTTQEQTDYTHQTLEWDHLVRPMRVASTGPSGSTGDTYAYRDNLARWIMGAVASVSDSTSGEEISASVYDDLVRPVEKRAFGLVTIRMGYYPDGSVSSASDATGRTTQFQQWHRGIPRRVQHPDGSTVLATVDDNGWLRSTTDENGFTTSYDYDPMGRPTLVQAPADIDQTWTPTQTQLLRLTSAESGMAAGHWKQIESTGSAKYITYLDGLWRPVLLESFDAKDREGTLSQVFRTFDHQNRVMFESYPGRYR